MRLKQILKWIVPLAAALLLLSAGAPAKEKWASDWEKKGWVRLSAEEVKKTMLNATLSPDGKGYQVYVASDGTMIFKSFLGWKDKGKGKITKDGLFCRTWVNLRSGKTLCTSMWKKGDTYMSVKKNGQLFRTLVIVRGNPEKI